MPGEVDQAGGDDGAIGEVEVMNIAQAIEESDIFFVLITENYFNDPQLVWQKEFAMSLEKPFRVALKNGIRIPDRYFEGIDDIRIQEWTTKEDLDRVTADLLRE